MQVALIIEGVFFYSLSLPKNLSPGATPLTLSRGMCAYLLWSLPPMLAYLLFCRGPPAKSSQILRACPNNRGQLTILIILPILTNEPSQPSRIQNREYRIEHRESSYLRAYKALHLSRTLYKSATFYAKQTQFPKGQNERKFYFNNGL